MKSLILFFFLLFISQSVFAQAVGVEEVGRDTLYYIPAYSTPGEELVVVCIDGIPFSSKQNGRFISYIIEVKMIDRLAVPGKIFSAHNLLSLPQRNVNKVVNTVAGVDSRTGETPYIRGARPEHVAYYMDGMRLRFVEEQNNDWASLLKVK